MPILIGVAAVALCRYAGATMSAELASAPFRIRRRVVVLVIVVLVLVMASSLLSCIVAASPDRRALGAQLDEIGAVIGRGRRGEEHRGGDVVDGERRVGARRHRLE